VEGQVAAGVAAIVVLGDSVNLVAPATAAIAAGIPVFGSDAAYLGDTGAVYIDLDERAVARLQGRLAGVYAANTWRDSTGIAAATLNSSGPAGRDPIADAVERSVSLSNPNVYSIGRFKSSPKSAKAGIVAALKQVRDLKVLLGPNAARGIADLKSIKKPRPPKDLVAFGLRCTDAMKDQITAGLRIKGCVDVDLAGSGTLLVDALSRVFAGGTVPGLIAVPIRPFPIDAATPPGIEMPG
jgi:ABC-type sugar transport system substrate-binding protein